MPGEGPWGPHGGPRGMGTHGTPPTAAAGGRAVTFTFILYRASPGINRAPIARMKMILIPIESLYKKSTMLKRQTIKISCLR